MFNTVENQVWSNITSTPAAFTLRGGAYGVTVQASAWGTATLQRLSPDGSTYITVLTAFSATGYASVNLPSGTYKMLLSSVTAFYGDIVSIVTTM